MAVVGLYFSIKLRVPQFTKLPQAMRLMFQKGTKETLSSFAAVSAVLGGNLGTGNIAGVAIALHQGGPGTLFWMWVMAALGMTLKMTGCFLGVMYRKRSPHGKYMGGPMYYLRDGLNQKMLSRLYCVFLLLGAITVGNFVQMNSLALPLARMNVPPAATGALMSLLVAVVIFGGLRRFSVVVTKIVPFMAITYVGISLLILGMVPGKTLAALELIFQHAFAPEPVIAGAVGYSIMHIINVGFDRGLFATDAGVGLAPIIHASVGGQTGEALEDLAYKQGLISMVSPLIVMIVCTITGLALLVTDTWNVPGLESTNACVEAFVRGLHWSGAGHIVTITLGLFAFTTILTWSFCADRAVGFLLGNRAIGLFRAFFVVLLPLGALFSVDFVWTVADISMNLMFLINIIGVVMLARVLFGYLKQKK